jgi:hypothetical protein
MDSKLDIGGTLGQVFSTYRAQAGVLLPVAFGLYLVVAVISGIIAGTLILLPLGLAAGVVAATLYQGMVVGLVRDAQGGRRDSSVGDLIDAARPVVLPLIGVGLLAGIAIGIGFLLFVVPGLILLTIWAVVAPVVVVERSGVIAAFGRSRELVRGNGWNVFAVILIVNLIAIAVTTTLGTIGNGIADTVPMEILSILVASTVTAPITALAAATIYYRLLEIEGAATSPAAPA